MPVKRLTALQRTVPTLPGMVRALRVFRHDLCWRLCRLPARTVERPNFSFFVYHDRCLPDPVYVLEIL